MDLLRGVLKSVSRSIYLSLRVLPAPVRDAMGLAYLFCRAADTIADTRLIPRAERQKYLELFRSGKIQLPALADRQEHASERALLLRLDDCTRVLESLPESDQKLIRQVVRDVTDGMLMDFRLFPGDSEKDVSALPSRRELDRYCYYIGGCPGIFWTKLCFEHLPSLSKLALDPMLQRGESYGKGLQLTNILRDLPADLRIGRCYIPAPDLKSVDLSPADLLRPESWSAFREAYFDLVKLTRGHLDAGLEYVLALPKTEARLRMACAWPLLLARKTLALLESGTNILDSKNRVKATRADVYKIMALSTASVYSQSSLRRLYEKQSRVRCG